LSRLRAAVIGLGVGCRHIAGFLAHPGCEVAAACDISEEAISLARREFPAVKGWTRDAVEILRDRSIDVVSIATYDTDHFDMTVAALRQGKHVFVEKPLCMTLEQLRALKALVRARPDLQLSSNLILRKSPRFAWLKGQIAEGRFGEIYHLDGAYNYGRLHKITAGWRGRIPSYSVVHGGAVHVIDLMRWLTGDEVDSVAACGNQITSAGTQFRFNDMTACMLRFRRGAVAQVSSNYGCAMPHSHALNVYGTKATFRNETDVAMVFDRDGESCRREDVTAAYPGVDKSELARDFAAAIIEKRTPAISADDVFSTMAVCIAVESAASQSNWVPVQYE